ncbi:MAG: adenosylmethionine--8-amino-7-oxononanoate transaminase [Candidatus Fermentibacteraceae bacterium]|nr:adenosylmethionine--8-amino-7-oxononanoate transaminase [Candidatus Fermentibacteraceae bacterium]
MDYRKTDLEHMWHPYTDIQTLEQTDFPVIQSAEGVRLRDTQGKEYLDGISSWWCVNLGHSHPHIVESVVRQAAKLQHSITGGMSHTGVIRLSKMLLNIAPAGLNRVYYASDGASSVEAAVRMAIQYWWNLGLPEKKNIISLEGAYHGDTLGAVGLGFLPKFHKPIQHVVNRSLQAPAPHCFHCPYADNCSLQCFRGMEELLRENADTTAAVIVEPVCQGAAGIRIYPPEYVAKLRKLCTELNILLVADEIAVGFGRTGAMFASDLAEIQPDLMVVGKSLTGGYLPMSAVVATDEVYDSFRQDNGRDRTFYHGHTFSGNPLAAAAAIAALEVFENDNILEHSRVSAELMKNAFMKFGGIPGVHRSTSLGYMSALEISDQAGGRNTAAVVAASALEMGLFIRPLGAVVYLWPPLITQKSDMEEMLGIFGNCLKHSLEDGMC